jgi:predicted SAM-dependent methyltransferase
MDFSQTRVSRSRTLTDYTKVQMFVGYLLRGRSFQARRALAKSAYLNLGCGVNIRRDFINLDYHWRPGIDLCWDLRRELPLPDQCIDGIYSEHCLDQLTYEDALFSLKECRRVLRPGGTARIVVPDAGLYADLYHRARLGEGVSFPYASTLPPRFTAMKHLNWAFRNGGHQDNYDDETVKGALVEAGFRDTSFLKFRVGRDPKLLIDSERRAVESLYVEAQR